MAGYNDLEEEGRFVDPYTNLPVNSSYWAPNEPNNWGVGEDCTELSDDLKLNDLGVLEQRGCRDIPGIVSRMLPTS